MKSKTLIALALASTFGVAASAFAGADHEVITPISVNESGPVIVSQQHGMRSGQDAFVSEQISSVDPFTANIGGLDLSDATDWSASYDRMAEANIAGDGLATDSFLVTWTPVTDQGWDYYIIDMQPVADEVALSDSAHDYSATDDYVALNMPDELGLSENELVSKEDQVVALLEANPPEGTAEVG
jgi:hypothetical protein